MLQQDDLDGCGEQREPDIMAAWEKPGKSLPSK